jgi:sec-independent protein translocase protein TatB
VFDVGFWELTFLATLALLVLGPDKLPGVVTSVGRMLGRARSLARGLKMQMEREMNQATTGDFSRPSSGPGSDAYRREEAERKAAAEAASKDTADAAGEAGGARTAGKQEAPADETTAPSADEREPASRQ